MTDADLEALADALSAYLLTIDRVARRLQMTPRAASALLKARRVVPVRPRGAERTKLYRAADVARLAAELPRAKPTKFETDNPSRRRAKPAPAPTPEERP